MVDEETFLYLITTGHVTGNPHHIEIWFVEHAGRCYILAEHFERTHWVQNIRKNPTVHFSLGTSSNQGQPSPATGRIINEGDEAELSATIKRLMTDKYNWNDGLIVELAPLLAGN